MTVRKGLVPPFRKNLNRLDTLVRLQLESLHSAKIGMIEQD